MVALLLDVELERHLIRRRRRTGTDRFDEVWNGVYVMSPMADAQHQGLGGKIAVVCDEAVDSEGLGTTFPGVNVSDRRKGWKKNFRIPDVAVFLKGTAAVCHGAFWVGGPDFCVEIASHADKTWEKVAFYEKTGAQELLVIDRAPWKLTLLRKGTSGLQAVGESTLENGAAVHSDVIPLAFQIGPGSEGIVEIRIAHRDGSRRWTILVHPERATLVRESAR